MPDTDTQTTDTTDVQTQDVQTQDAPADLDAYLATLPDETRTLVDKLRTDWHESQVTGLKSALSKEREAASDATKALRELAKTADKETAAKLKAQADENDARVSDLTKEAMFYREAAAAGVPADKLARAWLLCRNADYFTKRGDPDIAAMKAEIPELFAAPQTATRVQAGAGTRQQAVQPEIDPLRAAVARARGVTTVQP
jgi:hypothetical protein